MTTEAKYIEMAEKCGFIVTNYGSGQFIESSPSIEGLIDFAKMVEENKQQELDTANANFDTANANFIKLSAIAMTSASELDKALAKIRGLEAEV